MKRITLLAFLLTIYAPYAQSAEIFYCGPMSGVSTPLTDKPSWWNKLTWLHNGVEKTHTITGDNKIVIDGEKSRLTTSEIDEDTPLILVKNNDDKAELLEVGTVVSAIYAIDKANKKLYYVKIGIVPFELKKLLKIDKGYQMMMSADCR